MSTNQETKTVNKFICSECNGSGSIFDDDEDWRQDCEECAATGICNLADPNEFRADLDALSIDEYGRPKVAFANNRPARGTTRRQKMTAYTTTQSATAIELRRLGRRYQAALEAVEDAECSDDDDSRRACAAAETCRLALVAAIEAADDAEIAALHDGSFESTAAWDEAADKIDPAQICRHAGKWLARAADSFAAHESPRPCADGRAVLSALRRAGLPRDFATLAAISTACERLADSDIGIWHWDDTEVWASIGVMVDVYATAEVTVDGATWKLDGGRIRLSVAIHDAPYFRTRLLDTLADGECPSCLR